MDDHGLARRALAEALGTALLVVAVVGSGIMASRLSPDDVGLQLLENSTTTAMALAVLILLFGPVSGAVPVGFRRHSEPADVEAARAA
jgi:glycerol uptake facilitator-like aquaporin